jgi:hypothetical protein
MDDISSPAPEGAVPVSAGAFPFTSKGADSATDSSSDLNSSGDGKLRAASTTILK